MKKLYYLLFYKLYLFWKDISDDKLSDWKASIIIDCTEALILFEFFIWWSIYTKTNYDFSKYWLIIPAIGIAITNYFIFQHHDKWKQYEQEFVNHTRKNKIVTSWLVVFVFAIIIASLIFTFYRMSLIDWSK